MLPEHLQENVERRERWEHLTGGIEDEQLRVVVENLMDNTKKWIDEESDTSNVGQFTTFAFPLIRRIFTNTVARELVSIQPMNMPTGKVFYLDFKYGSNIAPTASGDRMDYQGGKFNPYFASGARGEVPTGTIDGANATFTTKIQPIVESSLVAYVDSVEVTVSTVDPATGAFTLASAPAGGTVVTADYNISHEGNDLGGEIEFDVTSTSIEAQQKRLKAKWTLEAQQDLRAYHGVDAEVELTALLGSEITREIDGMIIDKLYNGAGSNVNWDSAYPGTTSGYSKKEYEETLFEAIIDANNEIYKKRLVNANWAVVDPDTSARFEKASGFRYSGDATGGQIQKGVNMVGTLNNKYRVYVDPEAPQNKVLLGYKGSSFFETGFVYAPYIPIYVTPTIMDTDFKPRKGVMSRFATHLVSGDFYATVSIV